MPISFKPVDFKINIRVGLYSVLIYIISILVLGELALTIAKGPLEMLLGIVYGLVFGVFLWYFPSKDNVSSWKQPCFYFRKHRVIVLINISIWVSSLFQQDNVSFYRTVTLLGFGLVAVFGSSMIALSGAGPLGCLTVGLVAAFGWRKQRQAGEKASY